MIGRKRLLRDIGEFDLIDLLNADVTGSEGLIIGIGDDAAAFQVPAGQAVVTTCDVQVEDVHFRRRTHKPEDVGWRAIAVNLSDLAAMGAQPLYLIISLGLPADLEIDWIKAVYAGIAEINRWHSVVIIGGNVSRTTGPIFVDVTAVGCCEPARLLRRSGAKPGDLIVVTGTPGYAALGLALAESGQADRYPEGERFLLAHKKPTPRVAEGQLAAVSGVVHAMMDISDGFLGDLAHLCNQSKVGAEIDVEALPLNREFVEMAGRLGLDPVKVFLGGGEDYELLMAVAPDSFDQLASEFAERNLAPLQAIGRFTVGPGVHAPARPDISLSKSFTHF